MEFATPPKEEVQKYLYRWDLLENYYYQERSLYKLFHITYPFNNKLEDILTKVSSLNDFYSTHILNIYAVSKHIFELNIDDRLNKGDVELVDDIANLIISGKLKTFYSFATKYCSHHKSELFPIYDKYVVKALMKFKQQDKFAIFKKDDLKNYKTFKRIVEEFKIYYDLQEFSFKEIDKYLWQYGKQL